MMTIKVTSSAMTKITPTPGLTMERVYKAYWGMFRTDN